MTQAREPGTGMTVPDPDVLPVYDVFLARFIWFLNRSYL